MLVVAAVAVTGCGGGTPPPRPEPADRELVTGQRLARFAFERGQYDQAVILYDRVLSRAYARDDVDLIADIGYASALALLRAGRPEDAARRAQRVREELVRRGVQPFAALTLTEAVALYAAGDGARAETLAETVIAESADGRALEALRAVYVRGMVAADRGDAAAVERALAELGQPEETLLAADRLELSGRLQALRLDHAGAKAIFLETAELRRGARDYSGMARALAFAAAAAEASGSLDEAAGLYLRAGRSAAEQNRTARAKEWLLAAEAAAAKSGDEGVSDEARDLLSGLAE